MITTLAARELRSLFLSPLAWTILAVVQFILAWMFLGQLDTYIAYQSRIAMMENPPGATEVIVAPLFSSATLLLLLVVPLGNTSFMGVPMVQAFFGEAGLPYLIIYDQIGTMLTFSTYGSLILAIYGKGGSLNLPAIARRGILFPPTLALLAGFALRPWPYPEAVELALRNTSLALIPLVMTAIGFQMRWRLQPSVLAPLGFGLGIKLVAAPLVALLLCRLLGLHGLPADIPIFEAGMPPMVTAGALAVVAGMEAELAVSLVGMGIILSFGTLPLLYFLLQWWP